MTRYLRMAVRTAMCPPVDFNTPSPMMFLICSSRSVVELVLQQNDCNVPSGWTDGGLGSDFNSHRPFLLRLQLGETLCPVQAVSFSAPFARPSTSSRTTWSCAD